MNFWQAHRVRVHKREKPKVQLKSNIIACLSLWSQRSVSSSLTSSQWLYTIHEAKLVTCKCEVYWSGKPEADNLSELDPEKKVPLCVNECDDRVPPNAHSRGTVGCSVCPVNRAGSDCFQWNPPPTHTHTVLDSPITPERFTKQNLVLFSFYHVGDALHRWVVVHEKLQNKEISDSYI